MVLASLRGVLERAAFDDRQLVALPLAVRKPHSHIGVAVGHAVQLHLDEVRGYVEALQLHPAPTIVGVLQSALAEPVALSLRKLLVDDLQLQFDHRMARCPLVPIEDAPLWIVVGSVDFDQERLVVGGFLPELQPKRLGRSEHCVLRGDSQQEGEDNNGDFYHYHSLYYHKLHQLLPHSLYVSYIPDKPNILLTFGKIGIFVSKVSIEAIDGCV